MVLCNLKKKYEILLIKHCIIHQQFLSKHSYLITQPHFAGEKLYTRIPESLFSLSAALVNVSEEINMWKDGFYKSSSAGFSLHYVKESIYKMVHLQMIDLLDEVEVSGTWKSGEFDEAPKELKDLTGKDSF